MYIWLKLRSGGISFSLEAACSPPLDGWLEGVNRKDEGEVRVVCVRGVRTERDQGASVITC